jgi:class 3 adenylate cyclase/tetratricopeptide (TPR) repeat protein/ribosomal protein L40E
MEFFSYSRVSKMKCPKCQFENPEEAKFCIKCGMPMEFHCPKCGAKTPVSGDFCMECGHNLTTPSEPVVKELSFDEKIDKIQRYLPKGLTEKILSQRDKIEGERKQVTVMFCDMEGFTALSEKLGPEEAYSIMDQVYEILIHKVHDYEGIVNEMTGDGIMALFGAPIALEDAPQRAIRSSLVIHREMAKFSDRINQEREGISTLKMRTGIHTGPVVVGTLGNDLRVEFKAVGETVNLASRMEGLAEAGSTYVTEETFRLTEGIFRFEALGAKEVKGKEEPVKTYRVIAPSTSRTRFDVSAERGLIPFVGRERELELLLDGFERCKEGRGQAFSIVAEAGVGKSRLLYEFRKAVANEDVTFLEGKCLSYSRDVVYHPIIDVVKSTFYVREGDGDSEIRQKVKKGIEILKADEASTLPYLLDLLAVKDSGMEQIPMSPEMRKNRILETLTRIILKGSELRPLIMAIEDLHWIDTNSEDSLKQLLESISGARVLLIFTYRPEFVHIWGGRSYHSQMNLNRLSNRESLIMVSHLLGTNELDYKLEALILEKTEGVPFFIEEFIKSLKNLQIIERKDKKYHLAKEIQDLTIPTTIQDVIMARVDSLPEEAKELLQRGSVIEREFSHELIKRVVDLPEQELLSYLSVLKDSELLYERGIYPESTYIFKHALTREVVYDSILTKRKKRLHEDIGQAIEEIYTERLEEFYEMLAYHYSKSENPEKAYKYLKLSGYKAIRNYSNWEAFRSYREAIEVLAKMPKAEGNKREQIEVRLLMAAPMFPLGFPEDSLEILQKGERLSKELGDEKSLAHFLSQIGQYYQFKGTDLLLGIQYCEAAFRKAEKIDDIELMAPIGADLCILYFRADECSKAIDVSLKVTALLEKTKRQSGFFGKPYNVYSIILAHCGASMTLLGNFEEAKVLFEKGINFASKIKDLLALGWLGNHYGMSLNWRGDVKNAIEHFQNSIRYSDEGQIVFVSGLARIGLGWSNCMMGNLKIARNHIEKGLKILGDLGVQFFSGFFYGLLSMVHLESGDLKNAQHHAEEALKISQKVHQKWNEGTAWILLGRIFNKGGKNQVVKAEECILKGIKIFDELKLKPLYAQGYHFLGELYDDTGQNEKALENLRSSENMFREMGMGYWLARTHEVLEKM